MAKKKTASASPVVEPTASFSVLKRVRHDGEQYVPGEEIELTEVQAAHLISVGAVARIATVVVGVPSSTEIVPEV